MSQGSSYHESLLELSHSLTQKKDWKIAIDGPSDSGKGTLAVALSDYLGLRVIDTGLMYRAITKLLMEEKSNPIEWSDEQLAERLSLVTIDLTMGDPVIVKDPINERQLVYSIDSLKAHEVAKIGSVLTGRQGMRQGLEQEQKRQFLEGNCVMDGRNMWVLVSQEADLLLYLYADEEVLIEREYGRQVKTHENITSSEIAEHVRLRNSNDATKPHGRMLDINEAKALTPMYHALIDTSTMTTEEETLVTMLIMDTIRQK